MPFTIVRDNIVHVHADAIVCATSEDLKAGGGVSRTIFDVAGRRRLERACARIGHLEPGGAAATRAYRLKARHIIHTAGPRWQGGDAGEEEVLRSCYRAVFSLADALGDRSVAFPLIATGALGFPKEQGMRIACEEAARFLEGHEAELTLVVYDAQSLRAGMLYAEVTSYIDDHYVEARWQPREPWQGGFATTTMAAPSAPRTDRAERVQLPLPRPAAGARRGVPDAEAFDAASPAAPSAPADLDRLLAHTDAGFTETLLTLIDERHLTDASVYKRANLTRQHFSKIRSKRDYRPKKGTVLALALALELTVDETQDLLGRAGYALTHADKRDIVVEFFLTHRIFDVIAVNVELFRRDLQPLS